MSVLWNDCMTAMKIPGIQTTGTVATELKHAEAGAGPESALLVPDGGDNHSMIKPGATRPVFLL
jgi:hypothetical protein